MQQQVAVNQMNPAALIIRDLVKQYARDASVGPINLDVKRGEFFSLLGESGSGKTTLLRCIAGFEDLTSGVIKLNGEEIQSKPAHRRNVGLVFQSYALFPHRTVFENVAFGLRLRRVENPEVQRRVNEALRLVGMPDLAERYPSQLSGGQQQRVAIARALVLEPPLILFDEPLSNLDAKLRLQLRSELRSLQKRVGMTCVFVTHDQAEAFALSDRVAVLARGGIAQIGTPNEIYDRPASAYVADFVGSSNRYKAVVEKSEGSRTLVRTEGGLSLWSETQLPTKVGQSVIAMFRPEVIELDDTASDVNSFACKVADVAYLGEDTHLRMETAGDDAIMAVRKSREPWSGIPLGTDVRLRVPASKVILFEG